MSTSFFCPHCGLKLSVVFGAQAQCSRGHRWLLVKNGSTLLCGLKNDDDYEIVEKIKRKILQAVQGVSDCREGWE